MEPCQPRTWQFLAILGLLAVGAAAVLLPQRLGLRRTACRVPIVQAASPARPTDIRGRVVDTYRNPVAGQLVRLYTRGSRTDRQVGATTTGADGVFVFAGAAPRTEGRYFCLYVVCERPGCAIASSYINPDRALGVWLRVAPRAGLGGVVCDRFGKPVQGATVTPALLSDTAQPVIQPGIRPLRSDRLGRFTFSAAPAGTHMSLVVRAAGFADRRTECVVPPAGGPPMTVRLLPGSEITGRVTYKGSGRPAVGARIGCEEPSPVTRSGSSPARGTHPGFAQAVTDRYGRYHLTGLTPGNWTVFLNDERVRRDWTVAPAHVAVPPGRASAGANLVLTRGQILTVRVLDAALGTPIARERVGCYGGARPEPGVPLMTAQTGLAGVARLRVPPGPVYVYAMRRFVSRSGIDAATVTVRRGHDRTVTLKVPGPVASGMPATAPK